MTPQLEKSLQKERPAGGLRVLLFGVEASPGGAHLGMGAA